MIERHGTLRNEPETTVQMWSGMTLVGVSVEVELVGVWVADLHSVKMVSHAQHCKGFEIKYRCFLKCLIQAHLQIDFVSFVSFPRE